ncbi:MAG: hypothetical protein ACXVBE_02025 [Bdellovibrionota bacterium]
MSVLNILFWSWTYYSRFRGVKFASIFHFPLPPESIIWFSALYVFGCAFRSFLPRADVQRIVLFDTWASSVFVGRSVATFAELAFIIQWSLAIGYLAKATNSPFAARISKLIVALIFTAECFSWYAVITTHYLGNSVEESLWAISYTLIAIAIWHLRKTLKGTLRLTALLSIFGCLVYVAFMATVDVPMYLSRWHHDSIAGKPLLGIWDGLVDLNTHWTLTHDIQTWREEIPWMSLYFSCAVWMSLALCYLPLRNLNSRHLAK